MLDLLETLLARYGIQNLRYDGKMRSEAREATLAAFRKVGGYKVILISTKCGGVGLNLTSANRVVKCAHTFVLTRSGSHLSNAAWISRGTSRRNRRRTIASIALDKRKT